MKMTRIAMLSLAVVLYATAALAQHGHSGGAAGGGMGMGAATDHGAGLSGHGNAGSANGSSGSTNKATVDSILSKNAAIGDKITALVPGATSAADACKGFKNLGQCVAAAHVSKNLSGVNFYCLREAMTGNTQVPIGTTCSFSGSLSLGKAVQKLDPHADSKSESKKGETQAQQDLKSSGVQS